MFAYSSVRSRKSSITLANSSTSLAAPEQDGDHQQRSANVNRMRSVNRDRTTPPLPVQELETTQLPRKRMRMGTRNRPIIVQNETRSKPILLKDEPESDHDDPMLNG
jgi:activator of HSP90 ATPase